MPREICPGLVCPGLGDLELNCPGCPGPDPGSCPGLGNYDVVVDFQKFPRPYRARGRQRPDELRPPKRDFPFSFVFEAQNTVFGRFSPLRGDPIHL